MVRKPQVRYPCDKRGIKRNNSRYSGISIRDRICEARYHMSRGELMRQMIVWAHMK